MAGKLIAAGHTGVLFSVPSGILFVMHGSIPPVTMPPPPRATPETSPAVRARGWEIVLSGLCSGGRGGANRKSFE